MKLKKKLALLCSTVAIVGCLSSTAFALPLQFESNGGRVSEIVTYYTHSGNRVKGCSALAAKDGKTNFHVTCDICLDTTDWYNYGSHGERDNYIYGQGTATSYWVDLPYTFRSVQSVGLRLISYGR